jgi:hypothetical protein
LRSRNYMRDEETFCETNPSEPSRRWRRIKCPPARRAPGRPGAVAPRCRALAGCAVGTSPGGLPPGARRRPCRRQGNAEGRRMHRADGVVEPSEPMRVTRAPPEGELFPSAAGVAMSPDLEGSARELPVPAVGSIRRHGHRRSRRERKRSTTAVQSFPAAFKARYESLRSSRFLSASGSRNGCSLLRPCPSTSGRGSTRTGCHRGPRGRRLDEKIEPDGQDRTLHVDVVWPTGGVAQRKVAEDEARDAAVVDDVARASEHHGRNAGTPRRPSRRLASRIRAMASRRLLRAAVFVLS